MGKSLLRENVGQITLNHSSLSKMTPLKSLQNYAPSLSLAEGKLIMP